MSKELRLDPAELKERLSYDPNSGVFRWKTCTKRHVVVGQIAGTIDKHGYRVIYVKGYLYFAHRLAWLYVYGKWPDSELDHINLDPLDNSINNLRIANRSENTANQRSKTNNLLGIKGVYKHRNRYVAQITVQRKKKYLGCFKTPKEAHAAYVCAAKEAFGAFARG